MLLYGSLRCCVQQLEPVRGETMCRLLDQRLTLTRRWLHDLGADLLKHDWVTS